MSKTKTKKKLPSYTIKQALEEVNPCDRRFYSLEKVRSWFPGRRRITAWDVMKVPAKKFRRGFGNLDKTHAAMRLVPYKLWMVWQDNGIPAGQQADKRWVLRLFDAYERGEVWR